MATDEAILESTSNRKSPPTLRLYSWSPPCISLGYAQPISQIDRDRVQALGWDIVRRPTGGRAILHTDELTYSVAAPLDNPHFVGGVLESYKRISQGLVKALEILRLDIEIQPEVQLTRAEREQAICFELPSSYEITAGGKKLVGSAQVRRRGGVLQHGSLPLTGDIARICRVLMYPDERQRDRAAEHLRERATSIEQLLDKSISWQQTADAITAGFRETLGIHLEDQSLLDEEAERADQLCRERYEHRDWMERL